MRATVRKRAGLVTSILAASALIAGAPGTSASQARTADNARIFCSIEHGPTWTAGGHSGNTWYVAGLTTRSECKNSANWALILGKRITGHDGAAVQAYSSGEYGCVVDRTSLEAACYLGGGGAGAVGVIVIGNPTLNTLIPAAIRLHLPHTPLHLHIPSAADDPQAGVPETWAAGHPCADMSYTGPQWAFLLPDGTLVTGTHWTVQALDVPADADCAAIRGLLPELAHASDRDSQAPVAGAASISNGRSWAWSQGSWGCVSARDFTVAPSSSAAAHGDIAPGDHTVGLPFAGCARSTFPNGEQSADGTPGLAAALEQVIVYPNAEVGTSGVPTSQLRALDNRVVALRDSFESYGVNVVALAAITAQKFDQAPPSGAVIAPATPPSQVRTNQACGGNYRGYWPATAVPSAPWTGGGASGSNWTLATAGGYPCELAEPIFKVFLANLTASSTALSDAQLHRYGWECLADRTHLIAVCNFAPEIYADRLRDGVGHAFPSSFRVGVAAPLPHTAIDRLGTDLNSA